VRLALAPPAASPAPLLALGFAAACSQAALLREAMAALGGSELAWGAVLGAWLLGMGAGAGLGARRRPGGGAVAALAVVALAIAGVVLLRAAPALTGVTAGEASGSLRSAWLWFGAVVPAAVAGGAGFAALAARTDPASAYALESAGALLGGVAFTFVLAPAGSLAALVIAAGVVAAALLAARNARVAAAAALLLGVAAALPLSGAFARMGWRWAELPGELAAWRETRQQRLELAGGTPAALYGDGALLGTFPDAFGAAPRAHLLMLLHERPARVLAVGAAASGALPALLAHPVARLDVVEDDAVLLRVLPAWYGPEMAAALADRRVWTHAADPVRVVAGGGPWDLILLLDPDPASIRRDRTRTVEFLRTCAAALAPGGVLAVRVGASDTFLGGAGGRLLANIAGSLRAAFPAVVAVPGEEVILVAAAAPGAVTLDASVLAARWRRRGAADPTFNPAALPSLLDAGRSAELAAFLAAAPATENRRERPSAVLAAAALHEARGAPALRRAAEWWERRGAAALAIAGGALAALLVLSGRRPRIAGLATGAAVGFVSMGWWLLLLAAWQSTLGSVYAEVGALSAVFMAGTVAGCRWGRPAEGQRLVAALATGVVLSLVIAAEVPLHFPRAACVPLLLLAGGCTGAAFPGVARLAGGGSPQLGAGRGFAADEAGAAVGALAVGLAALPVAGMRATALGLVAISAAAAIAAAVAVRARAE
jgi:spermidine synthase